MSRDLQGKRALVTGSSSGIGEAIALRLASEGADIAVHGRNRERAEAVAGAVRALGVEAIVVIGDLARDDTAAAVADAVEAAWGGVDILVNNAGGESAGTGTAPWLEATPAEWVSTYQANVLSAVRMVQRLAPSMRERGWGRLIQVSSVVGHEPLTVIPDYGAAKAAMINMTKGLAKTFSKGGVTANSISPGLVRTPSVEAWLRGIAAASGWGDDWDAIEKQVVAQFVPNHVGRIGRPEDVAHAAAYLASPRAGFVTGTDMLVSGWQLG
jgi:NAD(P)-dependent dehydrogenase (short-subunit alcohol dehydrogenase family)